MPYAAEIDMVNLGLPQEALDRFTTEQKAAALEAISSEADSYISTRYTTPLATWPLSLRTHVARGAVYYLISGRGMNPNSAGNELIVKGYDDAIAFFRNVARGIINLPVSVTSPEGASTPEWAGAENRGLDGWG